MPNTLSLSKTKSKHKKQNNIDPWDAAITEAKKRISDLRFSIKDFQRRKERGDKWLGEGKGDAAEN
jgi:cell division protein FtsL